MVDAISAEGHRQVPGRQPRRNPLQRITGRTRCPSAAPVTAKARKSRSAATVQLQPRDPERPLDAGGRVAAVGGDQASGQRGRHRLPLVRLLQPRLGRRHRTLEVYMQTGRAAIPVGRHRRHDQRQDPGRPLDGKPGLTGSFGVKGVYDTSMDKKVDDFGHKITPEASGLVNWANDGETFGVTLFGSYQSSDFTSRSATSNDWNMRTFAQFNDTASGFVRAGGATQIVNAPSNPNTLVAIPNDSRLPLRPRRARERGRAGGPRSVPPG
ncbi:hypothetical protein ACRAWD_03440 [Caulobacter segnis]